MDMDLTQIVSIVAGMASGGSLTAFAGWLLNRRNQKRLNDNEVTRSNLEIASKYDELHNQFINRVRREEEQIDTLMERNRQLSDRLYSSEQAINGVNAELIGEKQLVADLRVLNEHYKAWRCILADCPEREPKNPGLRGQSYTEPVIPSRHENTDR